MSMDTSTADLDTAKRLDYAGSLRLLADLVASHSDLLPPSGWAFVHPDTQEQVEAWIARLTDAVGKRDDWGAVNVVGTVGAIRVHIRVPQSIALAAEPVVQTPLADWLTKALAR